MSGYFQDKHVRVLRVGSGIPRFERQASFLLRTDLLAVFPIAHCDAYMYATASCLIVAVPASSALFFFRVKDIYNDDRIITAFFGFLLFTLFGLSFMIPMGATSAHIGTTQRCILTKTATWSLAALVMNAIYVALIFSAIAFRIMSRPRAIVGDTGAQRTSYGLPNLSRAVLRGCQFYYLFVTVFFAKMTTCTKMHPPVASPSAQTLSQPY
jgi:hypothetical protein